jgi:hypothetical protein
MSKYRCICKSNLDFLSMPIFLFSKYLGAIAYALTQPPYVNVNEILIRPTQQER